VQDKLLVALEELFKEPKELVAKPNKPLNVLNKLLNVK
jgi:hypothetical protein